MLKINSNNFVPITRTPWGGSTISKIKSAHLPLKTGWPERIGESWEVSTDANFPSFVEDNTGRTLLTEVIKKSPGKILGMKIAAEYGAHSPLLLKWLNAREDLSVQLHPNNKNPQLKAGECGKPESWLVMNAEKGGYVYLGFKDDLSQDTILNFLKDDRAEDCLHKIYPKEFDYISVPTGCIHAVGPGLLIAEPQYVLPGKSGKTWRISDWRRKYNSQGEQDPTGTSRELHTSDGLLAIDWNLPRGRELEMLLVKKMKPNAPFVGDSNNPFALECFNRSGTFDYKQLIEDQFHIFTIWAGQACLKSQSEEVRVTAGESVIIPASQKNFKLTLESAVSESPSCALFTINLGVI